MGRSRIYAKQENRRYMRTTAQGYVEWLDIWARLDMFVLGVDHDCDIASDGKEQGRLARRGLLVRVQTFPPR